MKRMISRSLVVSAIALAAIGAGRAAFETARAQTQQSPAAPRFEVDPAGFVWIGGNGAKDHQILKFTKAGRFVMQIGRAGRSKGNADTDNLNQPADTFVYPKTNELIVADGYGNRRVIVFDATTGTF